MQLSPKLFANKLLKWYDQQGRKNLPWREQITAYRVWISEIMLQQTQVKTVIPYFQKFIARLPTIAALANAHEDEILNLWTGLGYYSRARNLHKAAKQIMQYHQGEFPRTLIEAENLAGIGRSTAGAILAIAYKEKTAILDGNVKRVLTRLFAISGWPGETTINQKLWHIAEQYTPTQRVDDYTQAIMDFGATLCTRANPQCSICPFNQYCLAHQQNQPTAYPSRKPSKQLPVRRLHMLILQNNKAEVYLEKRPGFGIWGGLWSFPECAAEENIMTFCQQRYQCRVRNYQIQTEFRHTFSHFHLDIIPVLIQISHWPSQVMDSTSAIWYKLDQPLSFGISKPVKYLLIKLTNSHNLSY